MASAYEKGRTTWLQCTSYLPAVVLGHAFCLYLVVIRTFMVWLVLPSSRPGWTCSHGSRCVHCSHHAPTALLL